MGANRKLQDHIIEEEDETAVEAKDKSKVQRGQGRVETAYEKLGYEGIYLDKVEGVQGAEMVEGRRLSEHVSKSITWL